MYGTITHPRESFWDLVRFPPDGGSPSASLFRLDGFEIDDPNPKQRLMLTDQDVVYFTSWDFAYEAATNTELTRLDLRTSETATLATFTTGETVVGVDATHLYLTAGKRLLKLPKPGDGQPVLLATFDEDLYSPLDRHVLIDEANIYVASVSGSLWSVPKEGGTPRVLATNFPGGIDHLAQDEGNIFVMYAFESIDIIPKTTVLPTP
jgi:hypothetical protein